LQLLEEYQRSVEQTKTLESEGARGDMESTQNEMIGTEKSQRRLRRRRAIQEEGELEVEVNKEDYLSEYLSTLSTEDLELLMRPITEPAVKIEDTKKTKNYKINLKKTAKGVALAIGILVTCFNVVKVTGFSLEDMWQKHLNEITVTVGGPEYGVPENEAEAMMNFIMLASKDAKVSYSVPSRLEKSLRAGDITNDEFVMDALKDIGMKVNLGFNMSEILEYLFENLLAYRVKDAIGKDIGRYGDESYYKDYKDVGMEDITLSPDYVGIHKPGELIYRIRAGEKVIFESNPYSSQIPDDVKYLMYFCGKDISWTINNPKKEELQDFHKCLSSFYEKKLTIEGDRLISSPATKEISFER